MTKQLLFRCSSQCLFINSCKSRTITELIHSHAFVSCNLYSTDRGHSSGQKANRRNELRSWVMGLTSIGISVGLGLYCYRDEDLRTKILNVFSPRVCAAKPAEPPSVSGGGLRGRFNFIAEVVEKCASPVVYIEIRDQRRVDFFTKRPATMSNGSGFIVKEDGLILTNAHVVINKPHSSVHVRLSDGRECIGRVETIDVHSDLATVRINVSGLPVSRLGRSSDLRPGEFVVALGSPLSLSNTVTAGVVSSVSRASKELGLAKDMDYIQTDAAITFGNSGGPLVNLDGEVIGINSMKVAAGISFAIPIDYAKQFLELAEKNNKTIKEPRQRRYVGITMLTLTPDIIRQLQTRNHEVPPEVTHGVLVWKVVAGSPAHNGGLKPADIITHLNSNPVMSASDIYTALEGSSDSLRLTVVRGLRTAEVTIRPEQY